MKRKDFNETLKQLTDCLERMCSGSRFHSDGAATANERAPNFVEVLGMTRSSRAADRSLRLNLRTFYCYDEMFVLQECNGQNPFAPVSP